MPFPSPRYLANLGIEPGFPALQEGSLQLSYQGSPIVMNILVQIFVYVFSSLGHVPRSGIARSNGNSMLNCLRKSQIFSKVVEPFILPLSVCVLCAKSLQ